MTRWGWSSGPCSHPELLGRPLGSPGARDDLVEGMVPAVWRCVDLTHGLDHETRLTQQPHPVPMGGMELDPASLPVHPVGLPLTAHQVFLGDALARWDTQRRQVAVGQE